MILIVPKLMSNSHSHSHSQLVSQGRFLLQLSVTPELFFKRNTVLDHRSQVVLFHNSSGLCLVFCRGSTQQSYPPQTVLAPPDLLSGQVAEQLEPLLGLSPSECSPRERSERQARLRQESRVRNCEHALFNRTPPEFRSD